MANVDTATALGVLTRALPGKRVAALNMANAHHIGGGYARGAMAQEEDLCRVMPALVHQLRELQYPLRADQAHFTTTLLARDERYLLLPEWQEVNIISAAMPNLHPGAALAAGTRAWHRTVHLRIRAVLHAAVTEKVRLIQSSSALLAAAPSITLRRTWRRASARCCGVTSLPVAFGASCLRL